MNAIVTVKIGSDEHRVHVNHGSIETDEQAGEDAIGSLRQAWPHDRKADGFKGYTDAQFKKAKVLNVETVV